ncbi:MAG: NAD(P)H-dependent glycerol-3-phosphate dehydrogenase [Gammaproteobacteria bacterium]
MKSGSILVIGAGAWGTALALVLARNGRQTLLSDVNAEHIDKLIAERCNNRHLHGVDFPAELQPVHEYQPLPEAVSHIVIASPCAALRQVLQGLQPYQQQPFKLCLACKGLEPGSLSLSHAIVAEYLPDTPLAILSGPSFAAEVAAGLPTAVTLAAPERQVAAEFAELFHDELFRIYTHDDVVGVQVGGAVKNVMAIAAGIADGLGCGANTRAALIARGLAEIMRLGIAMGGRADTFMGLAGLGDLVLTCTDDLSRNRRFGLALAQGKTPQQAGEEIGQVIEGLRTVSVVCKLAAVHKIEMPISEQVLKVVNAEVSPRQAVAKLLARDRKEEGG